MEIIGNGFLARHLRPIGGRHAGVTVLAAGVPRHPLPDSEHRREAELVAETLRRCRARGRLMVFFSTVSMYGTPGCRGLESDPVVPALRYGSHKLGLEEMVRQSGARHLILRLGYVPGPDEPSYRLLSVLTRQLRDGEVRVQRGARRDMIHVADFVAVFDRLLATGVTDEVINVASGDCALITDVVDHIELRLGIRADRRFTDATVSHCPSVAKLSGLIPEARRPTGYFRTVIDRCLEASAVQEGKNVRPY
ncbi:NAD(P)-dependent oxidoreductase [Spirillospora sp. NBC_00431]